MKNTFKTVFTIAIVVVTCCCITAVAIMTQDDEIVTREDFGMANSSGSITWTMKEESPEDGHLCNSLVLDKAEDFDGDFNDPNHPEYRATDDFKLEKGISTSEWTLFSKNESENRWVTTLSIADGIEKIGTYAFTNQKYLKTIDLYSSVNTIKANAFYGCTSISRINFYGTKSQWEAIEIASDNSVFNKGYDTLVEEGILVDDCIRNGHTYTEWTVDTWPTLTENGRAVRECEVCGNKEYREIEFVPGDVNCDGEINKTDVELISQYIIELIPGDNLKLGAADVNGDGKINVSDCVIIMNYINGKVEKLGELVR